MVRGGTRCTGCCDRSPLYRWCGAGMGDAGREGLGVAIEDRWVGMNGGVGSMEIGCLRLRSMTAVRDGRVG